MKVRIGLVLATVAMISGYGCAGGGGGGTPAAGPAAGPTSPTGEVLPPGIRPRDNNHTRSADLYLAQASTAAEDAEKVGRYEQALQAANDGITADPENAKSYFQAAQAHVGLGNFAEAAANFDRAEELYPRYVLETEPWREQGWVNAYNAAIQPLNAGDLAGAAEVFEQANALYSDRPEALLQLGSIYSQLNRTNESADAFGAAMAVLEESRETELMDTANADAWMQHWDIATMGYGTALMFAERFQEAADHYGSILADDPENVQVIGSLASVLSELGQADSVQALYTNLLSRTDLTERDYFNAGVGLYQIENWEGAAEAFAAAAEMNPFNRDARLNLAQTYMISENWALAVPACRSLLEVDPRSQEGWTWLARSLSGMDDMEQAGTVINQYQEFGYHVTGMRLEGSADGGATISGQVVNTTGEEGQMVHLRFFFGGANGQEVGSVDIRVQLPAVEMTEVFRSDFVSTEVVSGYRYEVVGG